MEPWLKIILTIVVLGVLFGLFILGYVLNKRTPKPAGCEELLEHCDTCPVASCGHNKSGKED